MPAFMIAILMEEMKKAAIVLQAADLSKRD
jgi:hypothetical protein